MMKWGRKKKPSSAASSSSTSSSHSHLISHVFPLSWLSKFKQAGDKPVSRMSKSSQKDSVKVKPGLQRMSNPRASSPRESNYYKDEDGFWRLSFGDEDRKFVVPQPYWGNCKTDVKEVAVKKKTLKSKGAPKEVSVREKETAKKEALQRTYRRIVEATEELHRELDEVNVYRKSVEKDLSEQELLQVMQMVGKAEERSPYTNSASHRCAVSKQIDGRSEAKPEWKQLKDAKIKEVLLKNEKQRKSVHISRELSKQATTKVRVRSPRTPSKTETCRIRAIEDMKKAKLKKKVKDVQQEEKTVALGSFAVVKRSHDPQKDFKDSMVEMIMEKRITRPEELESLLACYLTLNADEYHDLIIKVFRQVWCELE